MGALRWNTCSAHHSRLSAATNSFISATCSTRLSHADEVALRVPHSMNGMLIADLLDARQEGPCALLRRIRALATVGVDRPAVEPLEAQPEVAEGHRALDPEGSLPHALHTIVDRSSRLTLGEDARELRTALSHRLSTARVDFCTSDVQNPLARTCQAGVGSAACNT